MFSLFFYSGNITNVNDVNRCNFKLFANYFNYLLNDGVYIAPSQYESSFISLSHSKEILDIVIDKIDIALKNIFFNKG